MSVINSFTGEYKFLSNFYPCTIVYDGHTYSSVEHAFQAAKTLSHAERADIRAAKSPGIAKRLGRRVDLRPRWEQIKDDVMLELLVQKFLHIDLMQKLIDTDDARLIEGNYWHDNFWGICSCTDCSVMTPGENRLGELLMKVRHELGA